MMKKERLLLILCGLFCGAAVAQPRLPTPPNMIVILADDLGYGDLGCTGSRQIKTPSIDRLAKEGVFCSRAYVTAPMCSPLPHGIADGAFPQALRHHDESQYPDGLSSGVPLRAAADGKIDSGVFGPCGYRSAVFGKWHLGHTKGYTPPERGFTHWWGFLGGSRHYFPVKKEAEGLNPSMIVSNFTDKTDITYLTDDITDRAVEFLREAGKDKKPFFMFVSYNAPHWPNEAKPEDIANSGTCRTGNDGFIAPWYMRWTGE